MTTERPPSRDVISPTDVANLVFDTEDRVNTFMLAGRLGPGGFVLPDGTVDLDRARDVLITRAEAVPRLGQLANRSGRVWRWQDTTIEPTHHIRSVDATSLTDLCAACIARRLDHAHPLWEILLVPRISPGCAGIVIRIHHAVADGLAAAVGVAALADTTSLTARVRPTDATDATAGGHGRLGQLWRVATGAKVPTSSVLLGPTDGPRAVRFADVDLAAFRAGVATAQGTINDGVLAVVAGAVGTVLGSLGENPPASVTVSVPVALRRRGGEGNAIGSAIVPLPLRIDDRAERIRQIHRVAAVAIADAHRAGTFPPVNSRWMMRQFDRYSRHQRRIGLVTSDVPGPEQTLTFDGAPLLEMHGVGMLGGNVRISVVAASYAGVLSFGSHTAAAIPADTLADALNTEVNAVTTLAPGHPH